jgi:hypothetical protein
VCGGGGGGGGGGGVKTTGRQASRQGLSLRFGPVVCPHPARHTHKTTSTHLQQVLVALGHRPHLPLILFPLLFLLLLLLLLLPIPLLFPLLRRLARVGVVRGEVAVEESELRGDALEARLLLLPVHLFRGGGWGFGIKEWVRGESASECWPFEQGGKDLLA